MLKEMIKGMEERWNGEGKDEGILERGLEGRVDRELEGRLRGRMK